MKTLLTLSVFILLLTACNSTADKKQVKTAKAQTFKKEYEGTYTGMLPCDECKICETTIVLGDITEGYPSYIMTTIHNSKKNHTTEQKGIYRYTDETGSIIELVGINSTSSRYLVAKDALIRMIDGKVVQDKSGSSMYVLTKK